jgi:hypothetical protein
LKPSHGFFVEPDLEGLDPSAAVIAESLLNIDGIRQADIVRNGISERDQALAQSFHLQGSTIKNEVIQIQNQ